MTYEVKAFNSNATREPVVRVTSNKSRPQRIEQETRAARASIGGFHAISGDTNNNGDMNKCWWTNKTS